MALGNSLDLVDNLNGSITIAWPQFPGTPPDSYNVYLNGVLNQNTTQRQATITGLQIASYNGSVQTPSASYTVKVVSVQGGVERAMSMERVVTASPTSIMLTTPMKRPFPFPNVAP